MNPNKEQQESIKALKAALRGISWGTDVEAVNTPADFEQVLLSLTKKNYYRLSGEIKNYTWAIARLDERGNIDLTLNLYGIAEYCKRDPKRYATPTDVEYKQITALAAYDYEKEWRQIYLDIILAAIGNTRKAEGKRGRKPGLSIPTKVHFRTFIDKVTFAGTKQMLQREIATALGMDEKTFRRHRKAYGWPSWNDLKAEIYPPKRPLTTVIQTNK